MPTLSLIIPMYNESSIIAQCAETLHTYLENTFPSDYELIFVNDGSRDDCAQIVEGMGLSNVRVIGYETNRGKGYAVRQGMLDATGDYCMFTDADLAYGTDVVEKAVAMFREHPEASLVIGSRNLTEDGYAGYTWIRKVASKLYIKVLCLAGGLKLSDSQCGCKAFTQKAAKDIFSRCEVDRFAFDFESILWAEKLGYKVAEMPVVIVNHRESKVHVVRNSFRMLRDLRKMKKRIKKASV